MAKSTDTNLTNMAVVILIILLVVLSFVVEDLNRRLDTVEQNIYDLDKAQASHKGALEVILNKLN